MTNATGDFKRIEQRLDAIIQLLAAPLVAGRSVKESVGMLSEMGLEIPQIAAICGIERSVVRARQSEIRRRVRGHGKRGSTEEGGER